MTTQDSKSGAFVNDPEHWRRRAEAMRVLAEDMKDDESKATMLRIVADYEKLALRAEERFSGPSRSS
jgi:hypothetical protein